MEDLLYFPVDHVTLYQGTCKVDRKKSVPLEKGENLLRISGLPQDIYKDSVQIEVTPADRISIKNISTAEWLKEPGRDDRIKELKEQLDQLKQKKRILEARIINLNDQVRVFTDKEKISGQLDLVRNKPVNVKVWDDFFTFFRDYIKKNRQEGRKLFFEWLDLQSQVRAAEENYSIYTNYRTQYEHVACLTLEAEADTEAQVVLSYFQDKVDWHPAYKLTASEEDKKVNLTMYGIIRQVTGEDWEDIGISLSTAPGLSSCEIPQIKARKIKEQQRAIIEEPPLVFGQGLSAPAEAVKEVSWKSADMPISVADEVVADEDFDEDIDAPVIIPASQPRKKKMAAPKRARDKKDVLSQDEIDTLLLAASDKSAPDAFEKKKKGKKKSFGNNTYLESIGMIDSLTGSEDAHIPLDIRSREPSYFYELLDKQLYFSYSPESRMTAGSVSSTPEELCLPVTSARSDEGLDWRYTVPGDYHVLPSLDQQVQVEVLSAEIEADFNYITVPLESEGAYLLARLVNTTGVPYPAGPCQLVLDNAYLGAGTFETLGMHNKGSISLGQDRDIRVVRTQSISQSKAGLVTKEIGSRYTVTIGVENNKQHRISIEVVDRIPNSAERKEITLEKITYSEKPREVSNENIVTWSLELGPGEKKSIQFEYTIKAPENFRLIQRQHTT